MGRVNECGHSERKHYAKGMCPNCYQKHRYTTDASGRTRRRTLRSKKYASDADYRAKSTARVRRWKLENPERNRCHQLKTKYGITLEERNQMFEDQGKKCACCGATESKQWCVDHCHETGVVRGILCNLCNTGLGKLGDNVEGLEKALEYLKNSIVPWAPRK